MDLFDPRNLVVGFLLLISLLAGCIGGDDDPAIDQNGDGAEPEEGLGAVRGTIVTTHLNPVENARIALVQDADLIAEATSDDQGFYRINNVEPGEYRVQVTAPCCREHVQGVSVLADDVVDVSVQLEVFSSDDLQIARVEQYEWVGFLSCTVAWMPDPVVGLGGANVCGIVEIAAPGATDDDFMYVFEVGPGLESIVAGMTWRPPGAALGDELWVIMEVEGRPNQAPRYANPQGPSPLEWRADAGDVIENYNEDLHHYDFKNIENSLGIQYRIFASGDLNVVYQQQFTIYYDLYYWEPAPEGATAVPDS